MILPVLLPCICGSTRPPQLRRRGTRTLLQRLECRTCRFHGVAAGHPIGIYENWNRAVREHQATERAHAR